MEKGAVDDDDDPWPKHFKASKEDLFEEAFVVSVRAGHDEAPMTGLISESPAFERLFQAGFFSALPCAIPELSAFSFSADATAT